MNRFKTTNLPLSGLKLIERLPIGDHRGSFTRLFCSKELTSIGWLKPIEQINHSYTQSRGALRGMHFQHPPYAEMKLVTCLQGKIWDVVIDLRKDSATFLQYHGEYLSAENNKALLIPEGFAHGYQTISDDVELLYCHSQAYQPDAESGISPMNEEINIPWPLPVSDVSQRDINLPILPNHFKGLIL
ncbi:MAG: dTDP-4-dehydrorhamnose 3,5-epimerase family protein [Colwellia sp.]